MIFGIGIDMIEVSRIEKSITRSKSFLTKIFSEKEREYCDSKSNKFQCYAARFAAKEAFMKAIGTGWRNGIKFNEIEVVNNELGKPEIKLSGKAKELFCQMDLKNIFVSLSHLKEYAIANVIIEKI